MMRPVLYRYGRGGRGGAANVLSPRRMVSRDKVKAARLARCSSVSVAREQTLRTLGACVGLHDQSAPGL